MTAALIPLAEAEAANRRKLRALNIREMLEREFPPRDYVLQPILPTQGLAMLYAMRGIGKTHFALSLGYAVATGGSFLKFDAPRPRRVLLIDGEMTGIAMKERLAAIVAGTEAEPPAPDYFRIITPDVQDAAGMPDLATEEGQARIEPYLDGVELVIVDNLSCLCRTGKENEGEGWLPVQGWALDLRRRGIAVLFVHHAGKGGAQRGTSRREDVLDTVINLRRPADYTADQGARFEIVFEKARGFVGNDAKPLEAIYQVNHGAASWSWRDLADSAYDRAVTLFNEGMNVRDVGEELGISKSAAHRLRKRALAEGLIDG
jgi:putative DNA primase/helicase